MQPPHQHSRIKSAELKAQIVRKLGPERSKQYLTYLRRLLSLKLNKVDFNKLCLGIVGRENISLHNQFIRSILRNACTAKVPPISNEVEVLNATRNKEPPRDVYQKNWSYPTTNQPRNPWVSSNGDILPRSPRKARTGTRERRVGDIGRALGPNRGTNIISQQLSSTESGDFTVVLENGESIPPNILRPVQKDERPKQRRENEREILGAHPGKLSIISSDDAFSVHRKDQAELLFKEVGKDMSAKKVLHPPLGIPFWAASVGGSRRALPLAYSSKSVSSIQSGGLLDTIALREQMEQIASVQGLERVSMDCANVLNNGLDAYLKGLIWSCFELVRARSGSESTKHSSHKHHTHVKLFNGIRPVHHYQIQSSRSSEVMYEPKPCCPISMQDLKVAMELNPQQLGEDWPSLLEKICTHTFEEET